MSMVDEHEDRRLRVGEIEILPDRYELGVAGRFVRLTRSEMAVVELLARRPGRVYSHGEIYEAYAGDHARSTLSAVRVIVHRIRAKLGSHADAIETIHGVGFRLRQ